MQTMTPTRQRMKTMLAAHEEWVVSNGKRGAPASFSGMDLTPLTLDPIESKTPIFAFVALNGVSFEWADMAGVCLPFANLHGCRFNGANLKGADLRHASLRDSDFTDVQLDGAQMQDVNLRGLRFAAETMRGTQWAVMVNERQADGHNRIVKRETAIHDGHHHIRGEDMGNKGGWHAFTSSLGPMLSCGGLLETLATWEEWLRQEAAYASGGVIQPQSTGPIITSRIKPMVVTVRDYFAKAQADGEE